MFERIRCLLKSISARFYVWWTPPPRAYVHLKCWSTQEVLATENTEPDSISDAGEAVYSCPHCGARHRFLWGPPCPLYLGDLVGEA